MGGLVEVVHRGVFEVWWLIRPVVSHNGRHRWMSPPMRAAGNSLLAKPSRDRKQLTLS